MKKIPANIFVTLLAITVAGFANATVAAAAEKVTVELNNGRVLNGEVDERTNGESLWLRTTGRNVAISRAYDWSDVSHVHHLSASYNAAEFRAVAAQFAQKLADDFFVTPHDADPIAQSVPTIQSIRRPSPHIESLSIDAGVANWDGDVESDGLSVHIAPVVGPGALGGPIEVGRIEAQAIVTLIGRRFDSFRGRRAFVELGRWNRRVSIPHVGSQGVLLRLPFQSMHPDFDLDVLPAAVVSVRLVAQGVRPLQASAPIHLRVFDRLRDEWQNSTGIRFFPDEQVGRNLYPTSNRVARP